MPVNKKDVKMPHLIVKLNEGDPVVLCGKCSKILRKATSGECLNPKLFPSEYCDDCISQIADEIIKSSIKESLNIN